MHVLHFMHPPPCLAMVTSLALRNLGYSTLDLHWAFPNAEKREEALVILRDFIRTNKISFVMTHGFFGLDKELLRDLRSFPIIDHSYDFSFAAYQALLPDIREHAVFHFSHEPNELELYRRAGVEFLAWLPYGMSSHYHLPLNLPEEASYTYDILFVGRTSIASRHSVEHQLQQRGVGNPKAFIEAYIDGFPELSLAELLGKSPEDIAVEHNGDVFFSDLYRAEVVRRLIEREGLPVTVVGDPTWLAHIPSANFYGGTADGQDMYPKARINLDFTRSNYFGTTNIRVFEILSCGGFCLTDNSSLTSETFTEHELPMYKNYKDLVEKIRFYLANPGKRREHIYRGWVKSASHTYEARLLSIFEAIGARQSSG